MADGLSESPVCGGDERQISAARARRDRCSFSLRALLLATAVLSAPLAFVAWQNRFVSERALLLQSLAWPRAYVQNSCYFHGYYYEPPWYLWPFETIDSEVFYIELRPGEFTPAERRRIERLFPEVEVYSDQAFFEWMEAVQKLRKWEELPLRPELEVFYTKQ